MIFLRFTSCTDLAKPDTPRTGRYSDGMHVPKILSGLQSHLTIYGKSGKPPSLGSVTYMLPIKMTDIRDPES